MPAPVTLIPSARRLMSSLRDLGYQLPSAVADLIDNCITAGATEVDIHVEFAGENSWIRIADNGAGMSSAVLTEAMRYGSHRDYEEADLGKFGLGLKTASLSQCRRLTVATRQRSGAALQIRQWDLDVIERTDRWELKRLGASDCRKELIEPLRRRPGTVVLWERLDRVLAYKLPEGRAAEHGLARLCREVEEHLGMVFHRFLAGESKRLLRFKIVLNGNVVEAWDPFARIEAATRTLQRTELRCTCDGKNHVITIQPYVLPNQAQFTSQRAHTRAGGPKKWNQQQGFYVYRGDRMIQSGGWSWLRTPDEHTKLARVAVEFRPPADCCFEINVSKMRISLPAELRGEFSSVAQKVTAAAQAAYRQHADGHTGPTAGAKATAGNGRGRKVSERVASSGIPNAARAIVGLLRRELSKHPRLLKRILKALVHLDPGLAAVVEDRGVKLER